MTGRSDLAAVIEAMLDRIALDREAALRRAQVCADRVPLLIADNKPRQAGEASSESERHREAGTQLGVTLTACQELAGRTHPNRRQTASRRFCL